MTNNEVKEILHKCINALNYVEMIAHLPDCNDCAIHNNCKYAPKLGEIVRINCPLHKKKV